MANAEVQERGGRVRYMGRSSRHRHFSDGLILGFEIELDLHIVGVTEKYLPTSAIRHLVYSIEHALAGVIASKPRLLNAT